MFFLLQLWIHFPPSRILCLDDLRILPRAVQNVLANRHCFDCSQPLCSRIFIWSLKARIESRENWTPAQNGRHDGIRGLRFHFFIRVRWKMRSCESNSFGNGQIITKQKLETRMTVCCKSLHLDWQLSFTLQTETCTGITLVIYQSRISNLLE